MSTHNICFKQKYEKYQNFLSEIFHFLVVKFSVYLNRHVFVMHVQRRLFAWCSLVYYDREIYWTNEISICAVSCHLFRSKCPVRSGMYTAHYAGR